MDQQQKKMVMIGVIALLGVAALAAFFWPRGGTVIDPAAEQAAAEGDKVYQDQATATPVAEPPPPKHEKPTRSVKPMN